MEKLMEEVESRRVLLGLSQRALVKLLKLPNCSEGPYYGRVQRGKRPMPLRWVPRLKQFLEAADGMFYVLDCKKSGTQVMVFTGAELRQLAVIAESVGHPLMIDTLVRIAAEIKTAASP